MKKFFLLLIILVFIGLGWTDERYNVYIPMFMSRENLENSVSYITGKREIKNTGKIYYLNPYIYINERYKGVHVINNSDPAHPVCEGFILAPGCIDMAVKENIIYLDNAVDMVAFDLNSKTVTQRIRNVFPEPVSPEGLYEGIAGNRPAGYILVEWRKNN
jgi:hypothetical protein